MKKATFCLLTIMIVTTSLRLAHQAEAAPKIVDFRNNIAALNIPIKSQGDRNTCSVYATIFLLEYETAKATNQKGVDFSEDYLNAVTDLARGATDDGDYYNNILAGYLQYGTIDESDFPTNTKSYDANNVPSKTLQQDGKQNIKFVPTFIRQNPAGDNPWGLSDDNINQIVAQLDAGRPVAAGWRLAASGSIETVKVLGVDVWSKNAYKSPEDMTGHSMDIVGYVRGTPAEGSYFIIRNSGGPDWGDKGYWYCTFDFAKQNIADAFYFKPKTLELRVQLPQLIRKPAPRYMRLNQLRQIRVLGNKTMVTLH